MPAYVCEEGLPVRVARPAPKWRIRSVPIGDQGVGVVVLLDDIGVLDAVRVGAQEAAHVRFQQML